MLFVMSTTQRKETNKPGHFIISLKQDHTQRYGDGRGWQTNDIQMHTHNKNNTNYPRYKIYQKQIVSLPATN